MFLGDSLQRMCCREFNIAPASYETLRVVTKDSSSDAANVQTSADAPVPDGWVSALDRDPATVRHSYSVSVCLDPTTHLACSRLPVAALRASPRAGRQRMP